MSLDEQQLQTILSELRVLEAYLNEVNARQQVLARAIVESRAALEALGSLDSTKSSEAYVPLGSGLFVLSDIPPPDRLLVAVGAEVVLEKSKGDAIILTEEKVKQLEEAITSLENQKVELANRINQNRSVLSNLMETAKRAQ